MSFLFGNKPMAAGSREFIGFRVQSSAYGLAIPLVYGAARVAGNVLDFIDSKRVDTSTTSSQGGKWGGKVTTASFEYFAAIALALCEGQIAGIGNYWVDKDQAQAFAGSGFTLFDGGPAQTPWGYMTSNHSSRAVPYQGTAYVAHPTWPLGDGDVLQNYSWEVQGLLRYNAGGGIIDASPKDVVTDFLTHATHGAGFPSAQLGNWTDFANYCIAAGLFCSPAFTSQSAARDQLADLMKIANCAFVWSDGLLKVVPYADAPITGNAVTYTPNMTPVYDLTVDHFIAAPGTDPVRVKRRKAAEAYNSVTVEFENRAQDYNVDTVEAKDDAAIAAYGLREADVVKLPAIKDASTARYVAQLLLQRSVYVRNDYEFELGLKFSLVEPMDIVSLTEPGLGLVTYPVRITDVEETETGTFKITAEDLAQGAGSASRYGAAAGGGYTGGTGALPGGTTNTVIIEAPSVLAIAGGEIWIAAAGGTDWGGCDVFMATDNVNFKRVATITGPGTFGVLTAALAGNGAYPGTTDTTHTLAVDLTASGGGLTSVSASDLAAYATLCIIDSEVLAFQNAALSSAFHYNLTTLARGLFDPDNAGLAASHASGAIFLRKNDAVCTIALNGSNLVPGQTVYFKFPAFNQYGRNRQSLGSAPSVSYVIGTGSLLKPKGDKFGHPFRFWPFDDGLFSARGDASDPTGATLPSSQRIVDGTQGRNLQRGYQSGWARDGDVIAFSPAYSVIPITAVSPGPGCINSQPDATKWSPAAYSTTLPVLPDFRFTALTATQGTIRAKLRQKATPTVRQTDFPNTTLTSAGSETLIAANAPSQSGTYTIRYNWSVTTESFKAGVSRTATLVVTVRKRLGGPSGTPTTLSTKSYQITDPDGTGPYMNSGIEVLTVAASLAASDYVEIEFTSLSHAGSLLGSDSASVRGGVHTDPAPANVYGLEFTTAATADPITSATPDTGDLVFWEAWLP